VPLLQEYFYNDDQRLREVLGAKFFVKRETPETIFERAPETLDTETEHYDLQRFEDDDENFLAALQAIY